MDMTEVEKTECAKCKLDLANIDLQFAIRRTSELPDEFTRLEVQIATILLAFAGLFFGFFSEQKIQDFSYHIGLGLKLMFAFGLFSLITSLAVGLLHIKRKEKWWSELLTGSGQRVTYWTKVFEKEATFEQGKSFAKGTALGREGTFSSPLWTWIIQTICLGFAIVLLFILFLIFLFH